MSTRIRNLSSMYIESALNLLIIIFGKMYRVGFLLRLGLLCLAISVKRVASNFGLSPYVVRTVNSAITDGSTLAGSSLNALMTVQHGDQSATGIEIDNWTKFPIKDLFEDVKAGSVSVVPYRGVGPGKREVMVMWSENDGTNVNTGKGTHGTVSWLIESDPLPRRRLVIMWSSHYSTLYGGANDFWLGVGLTTPGTTSHDKYWFDQMWYSRQSSALIFNTTYYHNNQQPIMVEDSDFIIVGTPTSYQKAQVKVEVRPKTKDNLAYSLQAALTSVTWVG